MSLESEFETMIKDLHTKVTSNKLITKPELQDLLNNVENQLSDWDSSNCYEDEWDSSSC